MKKSPRLRVYALGSALLFASVLSAQEIFRLPVKVETQQRPSEPPPASGSASQQAIIAQQKELIELLRKKITKLEADNAALQVQIETLKQGKT
jgi:predicted RNase H-like nuclease (RuvC/YqgF family)